MSLAILAAGAAGIIFAVLMCGLFVRMGFPVPDEERRLGAIDGLRGYLALLVMIDHFSIYTMLSLEGGDWRKAETTLLNNFGAGSVSLFFMITGALFFRKTWNGITATDWRTMYISRVCRILPLQILAVTLIALVAVVRVKLIIGDTWISFPARFALWLTSYSQPMLFGYRGTAMINAFVLWSLWVEWKFYVILLPLLALAFSAIGSKWGRWLIPLALLASGLAFHYSEVTALHKINYSIFACGMLALLLRSTRIAPVMSGMPAALAGGAALILSMTLQPDPSYPLALAAYMLFFTCVICGNRFGGLLSIKGALVLGEASFSIYMLHGILLNVVFVSGADIVAAIPVEARPWLLVALIPLMSGISVLTYLLIERPGISLGRRLTRRWSQPRQNKADVSSEVAAP